MSDILKNRNLNANTNSNTIAFEDSDREDGELVVFEGSLNHVRFPRKPVVLGTPGNEFGITYWNLLKTVDGVIEANSENMVPVKGNFPFVLDMNTPYKIVGKRVTDRRYGTQYQLVYINSIQDLSILSNARAFLRLVITERQADEAYKIFDNPLEIIANHDIESLCRIKGVGRKTAERMIKNYEDKKDWSEVYIEMDKLGITPGIIEKLKDTYKDPHVIINKVKYHPYELTYKVDGIGFLTADKIALAGGLNPKSVERVKSYILYYLWSEGESGNSYVYANELVENIYWFFGGKDEILDIYTDDMGNITGNNVGDAMNELVKTHKIGIEENENKSLRRVYSTRYFYLERNIARELKRILRGPNNFYYTNDDFENKIQKLERIQRFEFTQEQKDGIKLGLDSKICVISGLSGTGKSSLVSGILAVLDSAVYAQCALSGKASARLQEVTGSEGKTIHRLLEYNPEMGFQRNESNPLEQDIIILDEVSMVGGEIFYALLKAIPSTSKLIMLGDPGQLEAVGSLNIATDMINSSIIPTVHLTQVHRQAKKSGILTTSYDVRNNIQLFNASFEGVDVRGELEDMILDIGQDRSEELDKFVKYFEDYYTGDIVDYNIMDIQVISPVKDRGETCVSELNNIVQSIVNPVDLSDESVYRLKFTKKKGTEEKTYYIQPGDKIMCTKNNYKLEDMMGNVVPVFNGWTGMVSDIDEENIYIKFPFYRFDVVFPQKTTRDSIMLGYVSTIHRLQGSEAKVIIGIVDYSTPPSMLTCQLVYTLITRAKKKCILIAENGALRKAIATDYVSTKRTFLPEFLEDSSIF